MSTEQLISTQQLARRFDVRPETVLRWVSRGLVPSIKAGKARRFLFSAVVAALVARDAFPVSEAQGSSS